VIVYRPYYVASFLLGEVGREGIGTDRNCSSHYGCLVALVDTYIRGKFQQPFKRNLVHMMSMVKVFKKGKKGNAGRQSRRELF
jgi:hypothetical protein